MGMYTGLRFKGIVKKECIELIEDISSWADWKNFKNHYEFLSKFADLPRADSIPFGTLSYMPDDWDIQWVEFSREINMETGYWSFQCSLKNYDNEIQVFLNEVLPNLINSAEYIEVHYEEWSVGKLYKFIDGKIIETDEVVEYY